MKDVLKQRLVGALVILALGAIFWPVLFGGDAHRRPDRAGQLPPRPEPGPPIKAPAPLRNVEPVAAADAIPEQPPQSFLQSLLPFLQPRPQDASQDALQDASQDAPRETPPPSPAASPHAAAPSPEPALDNSGIPVAWVLQVAAVGDAAKAEALTRELLAQGYRAYHRPLRRDGQQLHRVLVGPEFDRGKLADIKKTLDARYKVAAIIRYKP